MSPLHEQTSSPTVSRLSVQPWMTEPAMCRVIEALQASTEEVRFVGGCVRDALVQREVHDVDLATPLTPDRIILCLEQAGIKALLTGGVHGTVTAISNGRTCQISTLRRDIETDGRHAKVEFIDDWNADAARRDFTFNALSCTPDGQVYDPFNGIDDLMQGRVRFVGDVHARLEEDILRLLRFFRFLAHYGRCAPNEVTLASCRRYAPRLRQLPGERIRPELLGLLTSSRCAEVWSLMIACEVMPFLLPTATARDCLASLVTLETRIGYQGRNRALLRLAALLRTDRCSVNTTADRLRLSSVERRYLLTLLAPPIEITTLAEESGRRSALVTMQKASLLCDVVLLAAAAGDIPQHGPPESVVSLVQRWQAVRFPLTGKDVLAGGIASGPKVASVLKAVMHWWVEHDFQPDRTACLAKMLHTIGHL